MNRGMLALLILCVPALARDNGQYSNVTPEIRQWFRDQKLPDSVFRCCDEADATYAEEDIRNGVYWTRFGQTEGQWISSSCGGGDKGPNLTGAPVVWWYNLDGGLYIRCYAPRGGM
jgi:hypothetical protein